MHVRWLELVGFRNYASLSFAPDPGLNVLIGGNGQGKTSLLEALHLLLAGRSFRTTRLADCIGWDAREARIAGEIEHGRGRRAIRVRVQAEGRLEADGGLCPWARVVTFASSDLSLLTGPPQARRTYLDGATAKLIPAHAEKCRRYRLLLHQRGRLLLQLGGRADGERLLAPWDEQVATLGSEIAHRRIETLEALGKDAGEIWRALAPEGRSLDLVYVPTRAPGADRAATAASLLEALTASRAAEIRRGMTLVGPHRDDLVVRLGRMDARSYASRGEQRVIVLTLRLAEAASVGRRLGAPPVLLLDDVLSELDLEARERVLLWLQAQGQTLLSTTDAAALPRAVAASWDVRDGAVGGGAMADAIVAGGAA
ncbi:MAG: DNA replication/repair protein RecF [Candidatus Rokuibacteriota bacterium]